MEPQHCVRVAVLLATYNGARFVETQIRSLQANATPFVLHWLDDHSMDGTPERVRSVARCAGIELREWRQPQHEGVPAAFFRLLESVEADIYLFCDQDDIWQPGKIDATVASLLPNLKAPSLCFSDALMFNDGEPTVLSRVSKVLSLKAPAVLEETRAFMSIPAAGHTFGFTQALREIFLRHKDTALSYARMHDAWIYNIALASGTCCMLLDAPTTLYRQHGNNASGVYFSRERKGIDQIVWTWRIQQRIRKRLARHAHGFILASNTLPQGPKLERQVALARLVATLDQRQSALALVRLARLRAMWPSWRRSVWLAAACLCSDAEG